MPLTPGPTALLAGGSLAAGFAVAEVTGVRALGGVVLLLAVGACAWAWKRRRGTAVAAALVGLYLVLFVVSHVLGRAIGAWPSVAVVSVAMAAASYLADGAAREARTPSAGWRR